MKVEVDIHVVPNNSDGKDLLAKEGSFDKRPDVFNEDVYSSIENLCIGCLGNHLQPSDSPSICSYLMCNNTSGGSNSLYVKNFTKTDGTQLQGSITSIGESESTAPRKRKIKNKVKWLPYVKVARKSRTTAGGYTGLSKAENRKSRGVKIPPCTKIVSKSKSFSGCSSPVFTRNQQNASIPNKRHEGSLTEIGECISVPDSPSAKVSPNSGMFETQGSKVSRKIIIPCVDVASSDWSASFSYSETFEDGRNYQVIDRISSKETIENAASVKEVKTATSINYSKPFSQLSKGYEEKNLHQSEPPCSSIQNSTAGFMERPGISERICHDITLSEKSVDKNLTEPFTVNRFFKEPCASDQKNLANYKAFVNSVEDHGENLCSEVTELGRVSICSKTFSQIDKPSGVSAAARGIENTQDKYPMLDSYKRNNIDKETFIMSHNCQLNVAAEFLDSPNIEILSSKGICSCSKTSTCKSLENVLLPVSWCYASKLTNLPGHTIGENKKEESEPINLKSNNLAFSEKEKIFDSLLIGKQPVTCSESASPDFANVMDECGSLHSENDLSTVTAFQFSDHCLTDDDKDYGIINSSSAMNVVSANYTQNEPKMNNLPVQGAVPSANLPVISEKEESEVISVKGNNFAISGSLLISQQPCSSKEPVDLMDECGSVHTDSDSSAVTACEFSHHYGTDDDNEFGIIDNGFAKDIVSVRCKKYEPNKLEYFHQHSKVPSADLPVINKINRVLGCNKGKEAVVCHLQSDVTEKSPCQKKGYYDCTSVLESKSDLSTSHGVTSCSYDMDNAGVILRKNSVKLSNREDRAPLRNEDSSRGCKGAVSSRIGRGPCISQMFEYPPDQKILFNAVGLCCNVEQLVINRFQHDQDFLKILGRGSPDVDETLDYQKHYPWRITSYHAIRYRSRGFRIEDSSTLKMLASYKLKEVSVRLVDIAKSIPQLLNSKSVIRILFRKKGKKKCIPNLNSPVVFHGDHSYCKQPDNDKNIKKVEVLDTSGKKLWVSVVNTSKTKKTHKKEGTHVISAKSNLPHSSKISNSICREREKSACQVIDEGNQTNKKCTSSNGSQPNISFTTNKDLDKNIKSAPLDNKSRNVLKFDEITCLQRGKLPSDQSHRGAQRVDTALAGITQNGEGVMVVNAENENTLPNRERLDLNISMNTDTRNENCMTSISDLKGNSSLDKYSEENIPYKDSQKENSTEKRKSRDSQSENSMGERQSWEENIVKERDSQEENILIEQESPENMDQIHSKEKNSRDPNELGDENCVVEDFQTENVMVEREVHRDKSVAGSNFCENKNVQEDAVEKDSEKDELMANELKVKRDSQNVNSFVGDCHLKMPSEYCVMQGKRESPLKHSSKLQENNSASRYCVENKSRITSKEEISSNIFYLNENSQTKSVSTSSHIVSFCSKPRTVGTCSELEINSTCSEFHVVGTTHSEPQIIGTHSEPQNGTSFEACELPGKNSFNPDNLININEKYIEDMDSGDCLNVNYISKTLDTRSDSLTHFEGFTESGCGQVTSDSCSANVDHVNSFDTGIGVFIDTDDLSNSKCNHYKNELNSLHVEHVDNNLDKCSSGLLSAEDFSKLRSDHFVNDEKSPTGLGNSEILNKTGHVQENMTGKSGDSRSDGDLPNKFSDMTNHAFLRSTSTEVENAKILTFDKVSSRADVSEVSHKNGSEVTNSFSVANNNSKNKSCTQERIKPFGGTKEASGTHLYSLTTFEGVGHGDFPDVTKGSFAQVSGSHIESVHDNIQGKRKRKFLNPVVRLEKIPYFKSKVTSSRNEYRYYKDGSHSRESSDISSVNSSCRIDSIKRSECNGIKSSNLAQLPAVEDSLSKPEKQISNDFFPDTESDNGTYTNNKDGAKSDSFCLNSEFQTGSLQDKRKRKFLNPVVCLERIPYFKLKATSCRHEYKDYTDGSHPQKENSDNSSVNSSCRIDSTKRSECDAIKICNLAQPPAVDDSLNKLEKQISLPDTESDNDNCTSNKERARIDSFLLNTEFQTGSVATTSEENGSHQELSCQNSCDTLIHINDKLRGEDDVINDVDKTSDSCIEVFNSAEVSLKSVHGQLSNTTDYSREISRSGNANKTKCSKEIAERENGNSPKSVCGLQNNHSDRLNCGTPSLATSKTAESNNFCNLNAVSNKNVSQGHFINNGDTTQHCPTANKKLANNNSCIRRTEKAVDGTKELSTAQADPTVKDFEILCTNVIPDTTRVSSVQLKTNQCRTVNLHQDNKWTLHLNPVTRLEKVPPKSKGKLISAGSTYCKYRSQNEKIPPKSKGKLISAGSAYCKYRSQFWKSSIIDRTESECSTVVSNSSHDGFEANNKKIGKQISHTVSACIENNASTSTTEKERSSNGSLDLGTGFQTRSVATTPGEVESCQELSSQNRHSHANLTNMNDKSKEGIEKCSIGNVDHINGTLDTSSVVFTGTRDPFKSGCGQTKNQIRTERKSNIVDKTKCRKERIMMRKRKSKIVDKTKCRKERIMIRERKNKIVDKTKCRKERIMMRKSDSRISVCRLQNNEQHKSISGIQNNDPGSSKLVSSQGSVSTPVGDNSEVNYKGNGNSAQKFRIKNHLCNSCILKREKANSGTKKSRGERTDDSVRPFRSSCGFPDVPAMPAKNNLCKSAEFLDKRGKFTDPVVPLTIFKVPKSGGTINLKDSTDSRYRSQLAKQTSDITAVTCSTKLGKTSKNKYSRAIQNCPYSTEVNDGSSQNSAAPSILSKSGRQLFQNSSVCPEKNSSTCAAGEEIPVLDSCFSSSEKNDSQISADKLTNKDMDCSSEALDTSNGEFMSTKDSSKYSYGQFISIEKYLKDTRTSTILSKTECSKKFHIYKSGITASHEGAVDCKRRSQGWNESQVKRPRLETKVQGRKEGSDTNSVFPSELRNSAISSFVSKDFVVEQSQDSSKVSNKDKASHGNIKICALNNGSKFRTEQSGQIIGAAFQPYVCMHRTSDVTACNFICSGCGKIFHHKTRFTYHKTFLCKGRDPTNYYGCHICSSVLKKPELGTQKSFMVENQDNFVEQKTSSSRKFLIDVLMQVKYMFKCERRAGLREKSRFESKGESGSITKLLRAAKYLTPHYIKIYEKRKLLEPKDLSCRTEKTDSYPVSANSKEGGVTSSVTSDAKRVLPLEQGRVMRMTINASSCGSLVYVTENKDSSDVQERGSLSGSQELLGREVHDARDLSCRTEKTDSYPISANSKGRDETVSTSNGKRVPSREQVKELQVIRKNKVSSDVQERGSLSGSQELLGREIHDARDLSCRTEETDSYPISANCKGRDETVSTSNGKRVPSREQVKELQVIRKTKFLVMFRKGEV
ncbi:uncharacterized protein [Macrobrachium rosenbergii]|uniref:uncharacterized protein n=1 Tax=Macrobrachium rosenbergii TaxID=79674 RepID=UPI0034D5D689